MKGLVRAGRSGALALLPVSEAAVLLQLAAAGGRGVARARAAAAAAAAARGGGSASASAPPPAPALAPRRYGELFEALLRCAGILAVGLYRRSAAVAGLRATAATAAAVAAAAGAPGGAFANNRALISYVFTNPPPDTLLQPHDLVYVLRGAGGEDEEVADAMLWGAAESSREGALAEAEAQEA